MPKRHHVYETSASRRRREGWMRAGVWIFILVFGFSVAGGMILFGLAQLSAK